MGSDKALLRLEGETLVERALRLLRSLGFSPKIVGSRQDLSQFAPVVPDLRVGCGPLSGVEAGLRSISPGQTKALFIPVDAPLLLSSLLRQMLHRAQMTDAMATVPRLFGQAQPLCAIYDCRLLPAISPALEIEEYKVMRVVMAAALAYGTQAFDCYDIEATLAASGGYGNWPVFTRRLFLNCNTPAEFAAAGAWLSKQGVQ